ncbi:PadR family transcriptional regulator [Promicromonospora iranensis]|uniref:DNA-binding PadR family transcriptional regulator n=1 Tax=Promicromonospora iranensis TaxID=1105144 RepID=A0ABU2CHZ8_9MICO|nr:PadR family transcriptional regulator [Promicromonospora iranensis]MDR7380964.1 DNA-binding PadR family transcriptional regulator [Promicromonospora iranensis]
MALDALILGLLDLRPMTGYDLKKTFDGTVAHFWSADQSQIYRTLARLEQDGLVDVRVVAQAGKPDRREHRLTDDGRARLTEWLRSPLPDEKPREPFLGRLFFVGREDDPELVRALLAERRDAARRLLATLESLPTVDSDLAARLRSATLRKGILEVQAELTWLDELEAAL